MKDKDKTKVGMVSLGCPKNQVDAEVMLGQLMEKGYEIVNRSEDADIIIVNTCGFIDSAKEESIVTILEQSQYKTKGRCRKLIVAGCLAQRYGRELLREMPEIDSLVGTSRYTDIGDILEEGKDAYLGDSPCHWHDLESNPPRVLTTLPGTGYLKIAEGCDNCCSYCAIPYIRGTYISRTINSLKEEAQTLAKAGVKELILVAQDVTAYGQDLDDGTGLTDLLKALCPIEGIEWIRLLYCYPQRITEDLLRLMREEDKICKYLDIPLQHVNPDIIGNMNRDFSGAEAEILMKKIREEVPGVVMRTTFITGFPGEGPDEFNELKEFVKNNPFNHMGVFAFSREEGTPAANFPNQISHTLGEERRARLMAMQQSISKKFNRTFVGKTLNVIIEGEESEGIYFGRHYGQAPFIDGNVYFMSTKKHRVGDIVPVKITKAYEYDLVGDYDEFS